MTQKTDDKCKMFSMIRTLRKMFLKSPDKSQITLNGKCENCKRRMFIDIVPTSRGYGVLGGALIDLSPDQHYRLLCPVCHTQSMQTSTKIINSER